MYSFESLNSFKKNLLLVTSEFPPGPGGIGNHAYNLARGLVKRNYSVRVISIVRDREAESKFDQEQPFSIERIPSGKIFQKASLIVKSINKLSRDTSLTIVASGLAMLVICGAYAVLTRNSRIKFVLIAHGIDINPTSLVYRKLVSFAIKGFDRIIAVSTYTASKIKGVEQAKIQVINNGFDPDKFQMDVGSIEKSRLEYPTLVTVGSVTFRKGQINIINALPILLKVYPAIHYHMIGIEKDKSELFLLAKKLKVETAITFHGALPDAQVQQQLLQSDIFLMLSNHTSEGDFEGFGIAVLEANYLGIPAIGSRESGLRDAIKDGYSGFLIEPKNIEELKAATTHILDDLEGFKSRAREHALNFRWDKVIEQYVAVL